MKKFLLILSLLSILSIGKCQCFDDYFIDKTLRINYLHIGDAQSEIIQVDAFFAGDHWYGTRSSLIEPARRGDLLLEVFDSLSNQLIYSRSFSPLFYEFKSSEMAEVETGRFEESVNLPFPKRTIRFQFTSFDRSNRSSVVYDDYFNPQTVEYKLFTKNFSVKNIHKGGKSSTSLDILFIPDGYSAQDKKLLQNDLNRFSDYILNCSPFKENAKQINIRAVLAFSEDSGVTDPRENVYKNTVLRTSYNCLNLDRYLMCMNVWNLFDIADDAPYDVIVILVNSPKYGGGGLYNFYATVNNNHKHSDYVIVHEIGHLLAGLADEYFTSEVSVVDYFPKNVEPVEPNVTTLVDFGSKWKSMVQDTVPIPTPATSQYENVVGVYEGAGYCSEGVFRPWQNCTMKEIRYNAFCPVCSKAISDAIHYYGK